MSKNIVILSSSPRKGGNTDKLAAAFIEGALVMYNNIRTFSRWEDAGGIIAPGLHALDEIVWRRELEQARTLGREI